MDRDTFIITVFCLVSELYAQVAARCPVRRGGFAPALSDEEVITMEICGAYFKHHHDCDLYDYFAAHYRHFFPRLPNRSLFVRQAANLWQVKTAIWQLIVERSGQRTSPVQVIDTLPLPVCTYTRARRDRCFKTFADYGHCAAKKLDYYGFKLGLRVSSVGMITHFPLLSARAHDVNHTNALVEGFAGLCPADKGFIDPFRQPLLLDRYGVKVVTPAKSNMTEHHPPALLKFCRRIRKIVETVGSHLTERFAIDSIRVHDLWHFQHRLIRKVLSHTAMVFLNLQLGRDPLDLDGLVTA
ncbi:MAG TPA: IS982 family transposase [Pyrinomonadaceae bacterium]|nr:IS982 family transposase [Pyrinomonadaceae bacterium]